MLPGLRPGYLAQLDTLSVSGLQSPAAIITRDVMSQVSLFRLRRRGQAGAEVDLSAARDGESPLPLADHVHRHTAW